MKDKNRLFSELIPDGSTVCCAVSGGADSIAMLCMLQAYSREHDLTLQVCHFNHCLRGEAADRDEAFVRDFATSRGLPFFAGRGDVRGYAAEHSLSVEEAARILRYEWLETFPGLIATAHNADDNAETILLNLTRGTGLNGLCGIPPRRGRIIRPVLTYTHRELCSCLQALGQSWCEDATNAEDDCRRNRVRHHILPLLENENPALPDVLLRSADLLREENDYLDSEAFSLLQRAENLWGWSCRAILSASPVLQRRAVRRLFPTCRDYQHTEALLKLLESGTGTCMLPGNAAAVCSAGTLLRTPLPPDSFTPAELAPGGEVRIPELGLTLLRSENQTFPGSDPRTPDRLWIRALPGTLTVTPPRRDDTLLYAMQHRRLDRLLASRKLPLPWRACLPVLRYGRDVAAVYSIGDDSRFAPVFREPAQLITFIRDTKEQ